MKKNIYIIRHAEGLHQIDSTVWNKYDDANIPLTSKGKMQATECGTFLENHLQAEDTIIFSSPFIRAKQTADTIKEITNIDNIYTSDLLKEQDFGLFTGLTTPQCYEIHPLYAKKYDLETHKYGRYHAKPPQGESRADVTKRVEKFVDEINDVMKDDTTKNIIIVSHRITGDALSKILLNLSEQWFNNQQPSENASIKEIEYQDGKYIDKGHIFTPKNQSQNIGIVQQISSTLTTRR